MSAACHRCRNIHLAEHLPIDLPYLTGDILELKESVHTVVDTRILREPPNPDGAPSQAAQAIDPAPAWDKPDYSCLKGRPAVAMDDVEPGASWVSVCLLATFRGISIRAWLPDVFQRFCVPIHLHEVIAEEPHLYHAHTKPEWTSERSGRPNGWLIACSFNSEGILQGRWRNRQRADPNSESSFTIGNGMGEEFAELLAVCDQKWAEWSDECSLNEDAFRIYKEDYEVCSSL